MYYKICLRHSGDNDNTFLFWGKNHNGYTRSIEDAGLYDYEDIDYELQIKRGDFLVPKDFVEKHMKEIRLPVYSNNKEMYNGRNKFNVLPNTGDIRALLDITVLDFKIQGNRNSFNAYFESTITEEFKYRYTNKYLVQGKAEYFNEWFYVECLVQTENRNKAILKAQKELYLDEYSYIEFKKMVTAKKQKEIYFNKWVKKD